MLHPSVVFKSTCLQRHSPKIRRFRRHFCKFGLFFSWGPQIKEKSIKLRDKIKVWRWLESGKPHSVPDTGIESNGMHVTSWGLASSRSGEECEGDAKWNAHFVFVITEAHGRCALMWANAIDYTALAHGNRQQADVVYSKWEGGGRGEGGGKV